MHDDNVKAVGHLGSRDKFNNSSQQGCITAGAVATPKDAPLSMVHTERLFAGLSELQTLVQRIEGVADRISGLVPQATAAGNDRSVPSNLADRLDFASSTQGQLLSWLRNEIERVERFV